MAQQDLGFDTRSPEEILQDHRDQRQKQILDLTNGVGNRTPADRSAAMTGGLLANLISQKTNPVTLNPDEQRRTSAIAEATANINDWKTKNPDASMEDQGLQVQKFMAESLIKAGDMQGIEFAKAYSAQRIFRDRAAAEYAKLQGEGAHNAAEARKANFDVDAKTSTFGPGKLVTIWKKGEDSYESPGTDAFLDPDGTAHLDGGKTVPLGQYTSHPPSRPGDANLYKVGIGSTEAGNVRKQRTYVIKEMDTAMRLQSALEADVKATGGVQFLGRSGTISNWATGVVDDITGLARSAGKALTLSDGAGAGKNLADPAAADAYVQKTPALASSLENYIPANIRADTRARARWTSAVVQLAYARGMAAEQGARQLSDADFQNAVRTLAADSTDPEALRQTLLESITGDVDAFNIQYRGFEPAIRERIVSKQGMKDYEDKFNAFTEKFTKPFGTAGTPGPGITPNSSKVLTFDPATGTVH